MLAQTLKDIALEGRLPLPWRLWLGRLCFYILPLLAFVSAIIGGWEVAVEMGNWALSLFFVVLLSSPLAQLLPQIKFLRLVTSLRRELGVLSFWFVVAHLAGILYAAGIYTWADFVFLLSPDSLYFWGALGGLGMLYLGLTSNRVAVRLLKGWWKKSHIIVVYPTMIFSVIHTILAEEGGTWIALSILYVALKLGVYFKR